jgi:hypothetical protein
MHQCAPTRHRHSHTHTHTRTLSLSLSLSLHSLTRLQNAAHEPLFESNVILRIHQLSFVREERSDLTPMVEKMRLLQVCLLWMCVYVCGCMYVCVPLSHVSFFFELMVERIRNLAMFACGVAETQSDARLIQSAVHTARAQPPRRTQKHANTSHNQVESWPTMGQSALPRTCVVKWFCPSVAREKER